MLIAKTVLQKGLDSQTRTEIGSIDIADIDVVITSVLDCRLTRRKATCESSGQGGEREPEPWPPNRK